MPGSIRAVRKRRSRRLSARKLLGAPAVALALAACGEEGTASQAPKEVSPQPPKVTGNRIDRAFVTEMVPHHQSAVEMAELAQRYSQRPEIKQLSREIIAAQNAEIEQLRGLDQRLADAGVAKRSLGITAHEMGTHMDPAALRRAEPFERAFLDMMIPHHEGAIRMAQLELERGRNRTVKRLAGRIVDAQRNEIALMHQWRIQWFGVTGHEHH
jgi:uncharacterized protein (DUF305 family)